MAYTAIKIRHEHRQILLDVLTERDRQDRLRDQGKFGYTARDLMESHVWWPDGLAVLMEEVGEVAKALNDDDINGIRVELVQVAAVAVAMIEGLDARSGQPGDGDE